MLPSRAAKAVISLFNSLPAKCKPRSRPGHREWVPLTGILIEHVDTDELVVVSLATGMKCLPASKTELAAGLVLHDCHAEVLAMRGFNNFLITECKRSVLDKSYESPYVARRLKTQSHGDQPFVMKEKLKIHMFSTEPPCGDASLENIQSAQEDTTPWPETAMTTDTRAFAENGSGRILRGRGYFSELGCVRTKPGRSDAPPTLSKSCTDKLSIKQALSLIQTPASFLIRPSPSAYLCSLISQQFSKESCNRAFGPDGRLAALKDKTWPGGYTMSYFDVHAMDDIDTSFTSDIPEYPFGRQALDEEGVTVTGSNVSTVSLPLDPHHETIVGGVLVGRKAFTGKGASVLCKHEMWKQVIEVAELMGNQELLQNIRGPVYEDLKSSNRDMDDIRTMRQIVKNDIKSVLAPHGWVRSGGNMFELGIAKG